MTTTATHDRNVAVANGVTPIPFTFQAASASEVGVYRAGVLADITTYTVQLNGDGTGSVTPTSTWGTDDVIIFSNPDFEQNADWQRFAAFYPDQFVPALDRLARGLIALRGRMEESDLSATPLRAELASPGGVDLVNGAAKTDLSNITGANRLLTDENTFSPIGNGATTRGRWHTIAADTRNDVREFMFSFGADFSHGTAGSGSPSEKVVVYAGGNMQVGSYKGWAINSLLHISPGVAVEFASTVECDIDNYSGNNFGSGIGAAGLSAPSVYGHHVNGSNTGLNTVTAAYAIISSMAGPLAERGFMVAPGSVKQAAFDDYSSATVSFRDLGSHTYGLDLNGAAYSGAPIRIPNNKAIKARNAAGSADVSIAKVDGSNNILVGDASVVAFVVVDNNLKFTAVPPSFADDAAAAAGGFPIGGVYRTGSTLKVRVA